MKKLIFSSIFICLLMTILFARISDIAELQWIDPYGRQPVSHMQWMSVHCADDVTAIGTVYRKDLRGRQNVVAVLVNKGIYQDISAQIDTFSNDLVAAGYSVQVDTISGMSHTTLRSYLAGIADLVGALFIGELPVAWFETNGFGSWEEFPHDLYFCDLNGTYVDSDNDGLYDNHYGATSPEIWVGRIYARNLTWDSEIGLLKNYFRKNHDYRTNGSAIQERGLAFVDDDWSYWGTCDLNLLYSNVVVVNNDYQTTAQNYRSHLSFGYEWIHLCAHSSPWGHTFLYGTSGYRGTVFNYEVFTLEPVGYFYNLFACSGTRFVEENHSAGWYIFVDPYGLLAVGSTKTGSMLYFNDFYGPLGQQNLCIGDAFKSWFTTWGEYDWDWFYGMNILGDPTLKPKSQIKQTGKDEKKRAQQESADWEPPEVVAADAESDGFPRITTNTDGRKWVIWESGRSLSNGRSDIYASYNAGSAWSSAMAVGPVKYWDFCPDIGIDHLDRPVAVWAGWYESWGNYQYDIFYSVYSGSWSTRQQLHSIDPGIDLHPTVIRGNGNILRAAWESSRAVDRSIYISSFSGSSWSAPQRVTPSDDHEVTPCLAVDSLGNLWIFYSRRADDKAQIWGHYHNGSQWVESGPVSDTQQHAYHPSAAVDGNGNVWVAWHSTDGDNPDIYVSRFNGSSWSIPLQVSTNPESELFPDLTAEHSGSLWLVYQSKEGGDWNIYTSHCSDSVWATPSIVSNIAGADINPRITCSQSDEVWIVWQSYSSGNWEITVSHRDGLEVTDDGKIGSKSNFRVYPTTFSRRVWITTVRPNQKIKIHDSKGSLIKILYSDDRNAASWIPGNASSGIYFVSLLEHRKQLYKKIILIK